MIVLPAGGPSWSVGGGFHPYLMNRMARVGPTWVWCFFRLSCCMMSASALWTLSCRHLYLPWLKAVLQLARMYAIVPPSPHKLHSESSLSPHLCKFVGVGRVSYTDERDEKRLQSPEFCPGYLPLWQVPFCPGSLCPSSRSDLDYLPSSSRCRTSSWITSLLCLGSAFPHCWKWLVENAGMLQTSPGCCDSGLRYRHICSSSSRQSFFLPGQRKRFFIQHLGDEWFRIG